MSTARAGLAALSALALQVWQHALRDRGASVWALTRRLDRLGFATDPASVSQACRELVRAGYADKSPFGYRARQERQIGLGEVRT